MSRYSNAEKIERVARLEWVPLKLMEVNPEAQRDYNQSWTDHIVANFDPEQLGYPIVNKRGGRYYICDGQHRFEAVKVWLGDSWEGQELQCQTYNGLTPKQEAEMFLKQNDNLAITALSKFKVALTAERPREVEVDRVVRANGCRVSGAQGNGSVRAVGTLLRVYERAGADVLGQTIRMLYVAYGDFGLDASVIDAMALVVQRHHKQLDEKEATQKLQAKRGGVSSLLTRAEQLRVQMGVTKTHAVAGSIVETLNAGRGGMKLPKWWGYAEEAK